MASPVTGHDEEYDSKRYGGDGEGQFDRGGVRDHNKKLYGETEEEEKVELEKGNVDL